MGLYKQDISYWYEYLRESAIELVSDDKFWIYNKHNDKFLPGETKEDLRVPKKFRVLSSIGLELLIKAICVKWEIDIFQKPKESIKDISPFNIGDVISSNNEWLEKIIEMYGYKHLGHINTITFEKCILMLREAIKAETKLEIFKSLIDDVDSWRKLHRNVECHIMIPLILTDDYETLRETYNGLLNLYTIKT